MSYAVYPELHRWRDLRLEVGERFFKEIRRPLLTVEDQVSLTGAQDEFARRCHENFQHRLRSLETDLGVLHRNCEETNLEIADVTSLDGDYHYGTRSLLFSLIGEGKFVFRRGSAFPYKLYDRWLANETGEKFEARTIVGNCEEYLSRRFILADGQVHDIRSTFYQYGRLAGFAFIFNIVDLHCENLILCRGVPIPIDLECFLYPFKNLSFSFNLEATGLLNSSASASRRDVSGIFGGTNLIEYVEPFWILQNGINFKKEMRDCENSTYAVRSGRGDKVNLEAFIVGFDEFLRTAANLEDEVLAWATQASKEIRRSLVTSTVFYRVILSEASFLGKRAASKLFRRRLRLNRPFAVPSAVLGAEIRHLCREDIPYFRETEISTGLSPVNLIQKKMKWLKQGQHRHCLAHATRLFQA